ncbi:MAG: endo-1,3-beta-xylanase [Pseudomonadota bacterium]
MTRVARLCIGALLVACCVLASCASAPPVQPAANTATAEVEGRASSDPLANVRNVPAKQKVLFVIGQDSDTLERFRKEVLEVPAHADMRIPGGVTLYTGMVPTFLHDNTAPKDATLYVSGIEGPPADYGNGNVDFSKTLAEYDEFNGKRKTAIAVGLYLSDAWKDCANQPLRALVASGDRDVGVASDGRSLVHQWRYAVDRMLHWFAKQQRPVFLRIGYEFDGPWNCYSREHYKAAFRYIKSRIDAIGAANVATVWQAATYPDDGDPSRHYAASVDTQQHYEDWFPGEDVVDWIGVSFFSGKRYLEYQWSCPDASKPWTVPETSPRYLQDQLLAMARRYGKPALIAESAPQGTDSRALTWSCTAQRQDHLDGHAFPGGQALWDSFFADYFDWIEANEDVIRAFAYINTNWQAQQRWACAPRAASCSEGYWGNTSLQGNEELLRLFKRELGKPLYDARPE